ncbi:MAG TPA: type II toxin-antitoxin system RelE/ParE family toxin [Gemmataceae bacterium]|nr:type II toxin-antitoxin system RelE/ParE family toxin [Gemmataceae bacterium]
MANVLFHPETQAEYDAALAWYQARSPQAASRFEPEVEHLLGLIETNPALFPSYDDDHRFAVLKRFPYSFVYQVQAGQIYVVAVAHASRSAGYWQGRA